MDDPAHSPPTSSSDAEGTSSQSSASPPLAQFHVDSDSSPSKHPKNKMGRDNRKISKDNSNPTPVAVNNPDPPVPPPFPPPDSFSPQTRSRRYSNSMLSGSYGHVHRTMGVRSDSEIADYLSGSIRPSTSGPTYFGFTKRQWSTLLIFSIADLLAGIVYSLQAPFYPREAERKGATATEYGLVFGVFELTMFLVSPIYGKYMSKLGARTVFNMGIFTTGTCCIFFGLLDRVNDSTTFIALSFVIRIAEAIGNAGFATAAFTIIACEFPDAVSTTFASLETFFGLGLIVGPTMGGALYQLGGYILPFVVTGACLFLTAITVAVTMPKSSTKISSGFNVFSILRIPAVLLAAFGVMVASSSIGFLSATLEPHIRQFNLSPFQTGLVFIINGGVYALSAPAWGRLCDRMKQPKYVSLSGAVFLTISFLLIGPAPFMPFNTVLWVTSIGLIIQGLGVGATFVAGFTLALRHSIANGFPDNISTYSVVSGLWSSVVALGLFVGPSIAGVLYDKVGFRWGSLFVFVGSVILLVFLALFIALNGRSKETTPAIASEEEETIDEETDPLIRSSSLPDSVDSQPAPNYGSTL